MSLFLQVSTVFAIAGLTLTALLTVIRIVRGPTILDRMIASDVLLTTVLIAVGADMVLRDHTENIALMIAIAATAVLATIVVARYVKRKSPGELRDEIEESADD